MQEVRKYNIHISIDKTKQIKMNAIIIPYTQFQQRMSKNDILYRDQFEAMVIGNRNF